MWALLTTYSLIIVISGLFITILTGGFGMTIAGFGLLMFLISLFIEQPKPNTPDDITKKYCTYCIAEINRTEKYCPICDSIQD
tara:strand:+ start:62 stop:310 length:249 start_codon:yes stop_codon:yes gene_type:complete